MRKISLNCFTAAVFVVAFFAVGAKSASAVTYWISPTGAASNLAACSGSTPLAGTSACSYDKANGSGVAAGDTVYYRAGTYTGITGTAINPANTGTVGSVITFSAYNNESVEFVGSGASNTAVNLDSQCTGPSPNFYPVPCATTRNYIKVNGIKFINFMKHLWIRFGSHNEISHCQFIGMPIGVTEAQISGVWSASYVYRDVYYNWIHHNEFGTWGDCSVYGNDRGVVFQVGVETMTTNDIANSYYAKYNLIENNEMYQGGHHVVSPNGSNNVIRNNYFHNEPWCPLENPQYSTRTLFQTGVDGDGQYNLAEANRIGYGGPKNKNEIGGAGGTIASAYNIWRQNVYVQVYTDSMYVTKYSGQSDVKYNKIYNNTFWHGGYGDAQHGAGNWEDRYSHAIVVEEGAAGSGVFDNSFKNNLFYQNNDLYGTSYSIISRYYDAGWHTLVPIFQQDILNNWLDNAGDPKFVDISGTPDPANATQWNFNLQSSSPCIGAGTYLTTTVGTGTNATTLVVADASYFFDASTIAAGIPGATIHSDQIAVGTVGNTVQISSINYATNTIALASPLSWSNGASVWLYKKSDGTQVLYGTAPDIGAYEYQSSGDIVAPSAPSGLSVS